MACSSFFSSTIARQARSNVSRRLAGHSPPTPTASASIPRLCGFASMASRPRSLADSMNAAASDGPSPPSRIRRASSDVSGSRPSTVTPSPGETDSRCRRSFAPSQSAARHDSLKRGLPKSSRRARIASNGVRASDAPARTSSRPSMNRVLPRHSVRGASVRKSRAVIRWARSPPSASYSHRNAVDFPAPGSPSRTYAESPRCARNGRDASARGGAPASRRSDRRCSGTGVHVRGTGTHFMARPASGRRGPTGTR